ncbi:hypothetical protein [Polycladomyces abyssicola]|uniref:hypothetical protein n=1 Tax=Polycladomyces abyssicola TaxID=1125966 RepID=UPI001BB2EC51|nr:hypothetical protein [Polycladomyces abyssicola]
MKTRSLGFGFVSLFLYLLCVNTLTAALMFYRTPGPIDNGYFYYYQFIHTSTTSVYWFGLILAKWLCLVVGTVLIIIRSRPVSRPVIFSFWSLSSAVVLYGIYYWIHVLLYLKNVTYPQFSYDRMIHELKGTTPAYELFVVVMICLLAVGLVSLLVALFRKWSKKE